MAICKGWRNNFKNYDKLLFCLIIYIRYAYCLKEYIFWLGLKESELFSNNADINISGFLFFDLAFLAYILHALFPFGIFLFIYVFIVSKLGAK